MNSQLMRIMKKHAEAWDKIPVEERIRYIRDNDAHLAQHGSGDIRSLPPKLYNFSDYRKAS